MTSYTFEIINTILLAALTLLLVVIFHIVSNQLNRQQQQVEQLVDFQDTLANLVIQQGQTIASFYSQFDQFITVLTPILQNQCHGLPL